MTQAVLMGPDQLLAEFRDEWAAGRRPRVEEYLARAEPEKQADLRGMLEAFLLDAPQPDYTHDAIEEIAREPAVQQVMASLSGESGLWPSLLPRLRRQARLTRDEVVARLMEVLDLPAESARKTKRYLHGMESGTLEPDGVSMTVLDALAGVLGSTAHELERAGEFTGFGRPAGATAYLRANAHQATAAAGPTSPEEEWDEVDRLFRGGREE